MAAQGGLQDLSADLVSCPDIAERLGIHRKSVSRLFASGQLHGFKVGRDWLCLRSDLEAFAQTYNPRPGRRWPQQDTERSIR